MSNVKTIKTSNYVQLHNKAGLDNDLSAKAKGILFTAMALPPTYEINKSTFHKFFQDGRDSIKAGIEELVLKGYGFHEQINNNGKFSAITLISDVKLTTLAKLDEDELETFVAEVSDDLRYALQRIRETGTTYIGKLHNDAKKKAKNTTVTENPSREIRHEESVRNKELGFRKQFKDFEEEETITIVTESYISEMMHAKISERKITNEKTIKAILDVAAKCKAIGTADTTAAENYVIKVVEEKMGKLGQKQREKKQGGSNRKSTRKEELSEAVKQQLAEQAGEKQPQQNNTEDLEAIQRQLAEELKGYKKEPVNA